VGRRTDGIWHWLVASVLKQGGANAILTETLFRGRVVLAIEAALRATPTRLIGRVTSGVFFTTSGYPNSDETANTMDHFTI
jgi:hypothetical protein